MIKWIEQNKHKRFTSVGLIEQPNIIATLSAQRKKTQKLLE